MILVLYFCHRRAESPWLTRPGGASATGPGGHTSGGGTAAALATELQPASESSHGSEDAEILRLRLVTVGVAYPAILN